MSKKKKEFVSNVTGEQWHKHNSKKWSKVINQVGVILEDEVHQGKNDTTVTLKKGSQVIIDDIRGRIKPQYRVTDINGKIWFVSALNVEVLEDDRETNVSGHQYRGGVRHDGSIAAPRRYELAKTTEEEMEEIRRKTDG
tara:strand:- start:323 stop:739 length:417 start_codon:yes stop_codon:yes gene_type:complete